MKLLLYENSAGFSSYTYKLCNSLKSENSCYDITYLTQRDNKEISGLEENITLMASLLPYDNSHKNSLRWLINRVMVSIKNIKTRNAEVKNGSYDVVSIQATIPIFDQFYIKAMRKYAKVVYTAHDVVPPIKSFYYSQRSLGKIYRLADQIIVHSQQNKEQMADMFHIDKKKINVVFHGTERKYKKYEMNACREKFGISKDKTIFLFYGLIREQKGLADLIEAMRDMQNSQLVIAGAVPFGESFEKYQKLIDECSIDCKKFIQYIPNEWEDELFQACDIVCLPYRYFYSQSGVFMQCIQYRKPVVISDVSSFGEYLSKYKIGVLTKPNNISDLHQKMLTLQRTINKSTEPFMDELERAAIDNSWESSAKKHWSIFEGEHKGEYNSRHQGE